MSRNQFRLFSQSAGWLERLCLLFGVSICLSCWAIRSHAAGEINSMDELNAFAHQYYLNPQPERVADALRYVVGQGAIRQPHNEASISAFFSCLFFRHPGEWHRRWKMMIHQFPVYERELFLSLLSTPPARLLVLQPQSPGKNDMYWGCYFATGDDRYLQAIANGLYYLGERKNKQRFLMAALARWSLVVNAQQHLAVKAYLIRLSRSYNSRWRSLARDMLNTTPERISQETSEILELQRQSGIW